MKRRCGFYIEEKIMDALRDIVWHERTTLNEILTRLIDAFVTSYQETNGACTKHEKELKVGRKPRIKIQPKG